VPSGKNKLDRWRRIAMESAKQSRRAGVMQIGEPCELRDALTPFPRYTGERVGESCRDLLPSDSASCTANANPSPRIRGEGESAFYLSTQSGAKSLLVALAHQSLGSTVLFIGPEGGWTDDEIALFANHNLTAASLTATILRVETAAVAGAAIAAAVVATARLNLEEL